MARRWLIGAALVMTGTVVLADIVGPWIWTALVFSALAGYPVMLLLLARRRRMVVMVRGGRRRP